MFMRLQRLFGDQEEILSELLCAGLCDQCSQSVALTYINSFYKGPTDRVCHVLFIYLFH